MDMTHVCMIGTRYGVRISIVPGTYKTFQSPYEIRSKMFSAWDKVQDKEVVGLASDIVLFWFNKPRDSE